MYLKIEIPIKCLLNVLLIFKHLELAGFYNFPQKQKLYEHIKKSDNTNISEQVFVCQ